MEYVFRTRILIGGVIAFSFLSNPDPIIDPNLRTELYGITNIDGMLPEQIFSGKYFNPQRIYYDCCWRFPNRFRFAGGCTVVTQFQV
jgi:hypothetical protein